MIDVRKYLGLSFAISLSAFFSTATFAVDTPSLNVAANSAPADGTSTGEDSPDPQATPQEIQTLRQRLRKKVSIQIQTPSLIRKIALR